MAYETGTATDLDGLFNSLGTFLTANGWTEDESEVGRSQPAYHKNDIYVQFRYDGTTPESMGRSVGVYQSTGYINNTTAAGGHTGDSGNGYYVAHPTVPTDDLIRTYRCLYYIGDGPFTYWFFENDSNPAYCHIVVERKGEQRFWHFGFGELDKFGDWDTATGGEYCYGHKILAVIEPEASFLLDGQNQDIQGVQWSATMRIAGFAAQTTETWGLVSGYNTGVASVGDTRNPVTNRWSIVGGTRGSHFARALGGYGGTPGFSGGVPMVPIGLWFPDSVLKYQYFLGWMKDVRQVSIGNFSPGEEVVIGSDTWVFFPAQYRRSGHRLDGTSTAEHPFYQTRHLGAAYKIVTA